MIIERERGHVRALTDPQFWLDLESAYDIRIAAETAGQEIARLPMCAA